MGRRDEEDPFAWSVKLRWELQHNVSHRSEDCWTIQNDTMYRSMYRVVCDISSYDRAHMTR